MSSIKRQCSGLFKKSEYLLKSAAESCRRSGRTFSENHLYKCKNRTEPAPPQTGSGANDVNQ